jgi:hypothetical protein
MDKDAMNSGMLIITPIIAIMKSCNRTEEYDD